MPLIIMMVPRRDQAVQAVAKLARRVLRKLPKPVQRDLPVDLDSLPFIPGECDVEGYENMILVDQVEWQTEVQEEDVSEPRRTVHMPQIDTVKIQRQMDRATSPLTKLALSTRITTQPWELYFFRASGDDQSEGGWQTRFMTMKLYHPLISKYSFDLGEETPRENLEISPAAIEWIYDVTKADQSSGGKKAIRYDVQRGQFSSPSVDLRWP